MSKETYQDVIITFSDNTVARFTGKTCCYPDDENNKHITDIKFTVPKELPDDYHFEEIINKETK